MRLISIGVVNFLLFLSISAVGQEMDPKLSQCLGILELKQSHGKWRSAFESFKADPTLKSDEDQYGGYSGALRKVFKQLKEIDQIAGITAHKDLLTDVGRFIEDQDANHIPRPTAMKLMKTAVEKLSDALEENIRQGETIKNCHGIRPDLFPGPSISSDRPSSSR